MVQECLRSRSRFNVDDGARLGQGNITVAASADALQLRNPSPARSHPRTRFVIPSHDLRSVRSTRRTELRDGTKTRLAIRTKSSNCLTIWLGYGWVSSWPSVQPGIMLPLHYPYCAVKAGKKIWLTSYLYRLSASAPVIDNVGLAFRGDWHSSSFSHLLYS